MIFCTARHALYLGLTHTRVWAALIFSLISVCTFPVFANPEGQDLTKNTTIENFEGKVGKTLDQSIPAWPQRPKAAEDAPNIVIWLIDDAGFSNLQPYGKLIETPNVQEIANRGLTYIDFHSVPLCSPARAALLSGRNHHSVSMGSHVMSTGGFPGYNGYIPKSAASVAKVLKMNGYSTWAFGKWDQAHGIETSVAGPFDNWPSGRGFERFYGFHGGEAHHFEPSLWSDHSPISPAGENPDYFLTTDMADKAIEFIGGLRAINQKKPFFLYWATGAVHAPHHAPPEYIEKYSGRFDMGWDEAREITHKHQLKAGLLPKGTKLSPRRPEIPAWDDVPDHEKKLYARQMEAFAAQLDHTDEEFGRILDYIERIGELDNTIVIVTSDNGASAEGGMTGLHNEALSFNSQVSTFEDNIRFYDEWGGPNTVNHMHAGWAMASNSPFPFYKHQVEGGGTHVPMVISWPEGIKTTGVRTQYHHMIDLVPTLYDATDINPPKVIDGVKQQPLDGMSFGYSFGDAKAPERRTSQYYEIWGNRGMYKDGWKASTIHNNIMPWQRPVPGKLDEDVWRLYHVDEDFSQSTDLAKERPEKLKELQEAWAVEAEKFGVYPVDPDRRTRFIRTMNNSGRKEEVIRYIPPGAIRIPEPMAPSVKNKDYIIRAKLDMPNGEEGNGIIVTAGGITGGYAIYLEDDHPIYVHNLYNEHHYFVRGTEKVPKGKSILEFHFEKNEDNNGGIGRFFLEGKEIGRGLIDETTKNSFSIEDGFDIGRDEGSPVTTEYTPPFSFSGTIEEVEFDLSK